MVMLRVYLDRDFVFIWHSLHVATTIFITTSLLGPIKFATFLLSLTELSTAKACAASGERFCGSYMRYSRWLNLEGENGG